MVAIGTQPWHYSDAGLLWIGSLGTSFIEYATILIAGNALDNIAYHMAASLSLPQCVNWFYIESHLRWHDMPFLTRLLNDPKENLFLSECI